MCSPRLLPVPSAWWETPAITSRVLYAHPESARTARLFTREILSSWGLDALADEAETIIGELVVNAVQHGTRDAGSNGRRGGTSARGTNGYPRPVGDWPVQQVREVRDGGETGWSGPYEAGEPDEPVLRLCLLRRAGEVMLAVLDASDDAPTPRQPDWVKESGRGLQIIDALSSVWGWSPTDGHGKAVWAVLPYR